MLLAHQGHDYPVAWLECVSGEPFGFVYLRGATELFAVVGYAYHEAGEHLLRALGFDYSFTSAGESDTRGLGHARRALRDGPVAVGMLDMGYLTYAPDHEHARGADHAIVVLARRGDTLVVHDPAGYPAALLPLANFLQAWQRDIYTGKPYGLWRIGAQREAPDAEAILGPYHRPCAQAIHPQRRGSGPRDNGALWAASASPARGRSSRSARAQSGGFALL